MTDTVQNVPETKEGEKDPVADLKLFGAFLKSAKQEENKDVMKGYDLLAQGKRNILCGEITQAVNQLQEACRLLSAKFGETANELGDPYLSYGKALLDLSRMESGVLGNALQGIEDEDDSSATPDDKVEDPEKITGEEREKITDEVIEAMTEERSAEKKKGESDEKMEVASDEKKDDSSQAEKTEEKKDAEGEKKEETKDEKEETKENGNKDEAKVNGEANGKAVNGDAAEAKVNGDAKEEDMETEGKEEKKGDGEEKEGETEEDEEGESEDIADEEGETTSQEGEESSKEPDEDISNLQLAWEMLELAKVIYSRQPEKEMQLKAAEAYLKLGEVGMETEQYDQAVEDLKKCLEIQKSHLEAESRLIAETYYQVGLALCFSGKYDDSIGNLKNAVNVIESKLSKLKKFLEESGGKGKEQADPEDPVAQAQKEVKDLEEILPDILAKIEDTEDERKNQDKVKQLVKENVASDLGGTTTVGFGESSSAAPASEISGTSSSASDITHLVRKKRKPEGEPDEEEDSKKARQDAETPKAEDKKDEPESVEMADKEKEAESGKAEEKKDS